MFGEQKEIARFSDGAFGISLFQDNRRLDEGDEWVQFHTELTHPQGRLVLGEGALSSLPFLLYQAKQKISEQREKIEAEGLIPA